jgi:hypothetical protein
MALKLSWPTTSRDIVKHFLEDADYWKDYSLPGNDGISIEGAFKSEVTACAPGTVTAVDTPGDVRPYGNTVIIQHQTDDGTYTTQYCHLFSASVAVGDAVEAGGIIGLANGTGSVIGSVVKVILKQVDGGDTSYTVPSGESVTVSSGLLDPADYLDPAPERRYAQPPMTAQSVTAGEAATFKDDLNIRALPSTRGKVLYTADKGDTLTVLAISEDGKWFNISHNDGEAWGYAEYIDYGGDRSALTVKKVELPQIIPAGARNGVNLDIFHPLGKPDLSKLGNMELVRLGYNVSMGTGNLDLQKAYNAYDPYVDAIQKAGKQVIFVYTHQTFGEGAGYDWNQMSPERWTDLISKFTDFVKQIAGHYADKGVVAAHQIWNEQDAHHGAVASVRLDSSIYAQMLSKVIPAIRAVDPNTPIITGGHTGGPGPGSAYAAKTLRAMTGGVEVDGIALHPYGRGAKLPSPYAHFGHIDESVNAYWNVLAKPLWLTEWGVLNAPNEPASAISDYAVTTLRHLDKQHPEKIAATVWYAWADSMHNGYGLVDRNGNGKPDIVDSFTSWLFKFAAAAKKAAED